jgi:p-hydroxybenzoate 3-monooxygenase
VLEQSIVEGILAEVVPSTQELIYARHERGVALHSMRSPQLTGSTCSASPTPTPTTGPTRASGTSCASGCR